MENYTNSIKNKIQTLLAFATWILGILSSFIADPGIVTLRLNNTSIKIIANLLIALLVVTFLFLIKNKRYVRKKKIYLKFGWIFLFLGIVTLFGYYKYLDNFSIEWPPNNPQTIFVGNKYKHEIYDLANKNRIDIEGKTKMEVVSYFAPKSIEELTLIWDKDEIERNGYIGIMLYFLTLSFFTIFILLLSYSI